MTVGEILAGWERGWNAGDGAACAANFAEDAEFVDVVGRLHRGREAIGSTHQQILDTIYRGSRLEFHELSSRELGEGLQLVHTTSTLQVPAGPRAGTTRSTQTMIIHNGQVTAFHNTIQVDFGGFTTAN